MAPLNVVGVPADGRGPTPPSDRALVSLFLDRADADPEGLALRHKSLGIWHEITYADFRQRVENLGNGLGDLGVTESDAVAILARPRPEWLYVDLAIQGLGAVTVGLYLTASHDDVARQIDTSGATVLVADGMEQVDQLFEAEAACGRELVETIVVIEPVSALGSSSPRLVQLDELERRGGTTGAASTGAWERSARERTADDAVRYLFGAGATGRAHGSVVTSRQLLSTWCAVFSGLAEPPGREDRVVSAMPMAHYGELGFTVVATIVYGSVPHFPEGEDGVDRAFVEASPTLLFSLPRALELRAGRALLDLRSARGLKGRMVRFAVRQRASVLDTIARGEPTHGSGLPHWFAQKFVLRPLLKGFGLHRVRFAVTGGAPVSPILLETWRRWGLPLREFYGLAETSGPAVVLADPFDPAEAERYGVEVALAHDGEVMVRGPGCSTTFVGTDDEAITSDDGWIATGDLGHVGANGRLTLSGRRVEAFTMADGRELMPSQVETMLTASPYLRDVLVVGDGQPQPGALLAVDFSTTGAWARDNGVTFTTYGTLISSDEVRQLISDEVAETNERLAAAGLPRVENYRLLPKELDAGDEVTPIRTVRRALLTEKYAELIDDMQGSTVPG